MHWLCICMSFKCILSQAMQWKWLEKSLWDFVFSSMDYKTQNFHVFLCRLIHSVSFIIAWYFFVLLLLCHLGFYTLMDWTGCVVCADSRIITDWKQVGHDLFLIRLIIQGLLWAHRTVQMANNATTARRHPWRALRDRVWLSQPAAPFDLQIKLLNYFVPAHEDGWGQQFN